MCVCVPVQYVCMHVWMKTCPPGCAGNKISSRSGYTEIPNTNSLLSSTRWFESHSVQDSKETGCNFIKLHVILQLWVQLRKAISTLLFSDTEADWEMSAWDILFGFAVRRTFERKLETDTLYTVDVNTPTLHSRICVMGAEGKETSWKKISWKEEEHLECLCLFTHFHCTPSCTGVHSFAGPLHHLATHRGNFEPLIKLMCCDSGTNTGWLRPNFVSGISLSRGGEEEAVPEFVVLNEVFSEFCKLSWPWLLTPNILGFTQTRFFTRLFYTVPKCTDKQNCIIWLKDCKRERPERDK